MGTKRATKNRTTNFSLGVMKTAERAESFNDNLCAREGRIVVTDPETRNGYGYFSVEIDNASATGWRNSSAYSDVQCDVLVARTRKRRNGRGQDERQHDRGPGNRLGHRAGQHVNAASQRRTRSQGGQVDDVQHPFELFVSRCGLFLHVRFFPAQFPVEIFPLQRENNCVRD